MWDFFFSIGVLDVDSFPEAPFFSEAILARVPGCFLLGEGGWGVGLKNSAKSPPFREIEIDRGPV